MNGLLWLWGERRLLSKSIVCGSEKLRGGFVAWLAVDFDWVVIPPMRLRPSSSCSNYGFFEGAMKLVISTQFISTVSFPRTTVKLNSFV